MQGALDEQAVPIGTHNRYILFTLGDTRYGVSIGNVVEISNIPRLTYVPNVPPWVSGVTNLRGEILAVLNLKQFLGLEEGDDQGEGRLLVTRTAGEEVTAGVVVDEVNGVATFTRDQLRSPTAPVRDQTAPYLLGTHQVDDRLLVVLDLDKLLTSSEARRLEAP